VALNHSTTDCSQNFHTANRARLDQNLAVVDRAIPPAEPRGRDLPSVLLRERNDRSRDSQQVRGHCSVEIVPGINDVSGDAAVEPDAQ
jgi:hypothetical protein